jgi:hypothetical protein
MTFNLVKHFIYRIITFNCTKVNSVYQKIIIAYFLRLQIA